MSVRILQGDCREVLATLPEASVHCVVTSPPYWGLRDYGVPPTIWGEDVSCVHTWGATLSPAKEGPGNLDTSPTSALTNPGRSQEIDWLADAGAFCTSCGGWRGCLGLEPTPYLYVEHLVDVFRAVWRVLRPDGSVWLNLGDCYATGAGAVGQCPGGGEQGARWRGDIDRIRDDKRGYRGERLANGRPPDIAALLDATRGTP